MNPQPFFRRSLTQKGISVMVTGIMLVITVPFAGLAIDVGVLYLVKAKLQGATDAAALAAARNLNLGMTLAAQQANADTGARSVFNFNFPSGYMGSTSPTVTTAFSQLNASTLKVDVTGTVNTPLYFMRILGGASQTVSAVGTATRRSVNLYLVLDKSGSMNSNSGCSNMRTAATTFVNYFANGRDKLGLITFNGGYKVDFTANANFNPGINNAISAITCGGTTGTANAVWQAYQGLLTLAEPLALNIIVLMTDGQPNGLTANWPVKLNQDTRYGDGRSYTITRNSGAGIPNLSYSFPSNTTTYTVPPSPCQSSLGHYWYRDLDAGTTAPFKNAANQIYTPSGSAPGPNSLWTLGTLYGAIGSTGTASTTGPTNGLYDPANQSEPTIAAPAGCAMLSSQNYVREDIAYVPSTDANGNQTSGFRNNYTNAGGYGSGNDFYPTNCNPTASCPPSGTHPYSGKMRIDTPGGLVNASTNALDDAGKRIRNDATYTPIIYTIGLGGTSGQPADMEVLSRLANTGDGVLDTYTADDGTVARGVAILAPNPTQLSQAFIQIASSVLRLSH